LKVVPSSPMTLLDRLASTGGLEAPDGADTAVVVAAPLGEAVAARDAWPCKQETIADRISVDMYAPRTQIHVNKVQGLLMVYTPA
jgi:hypothetical protein